MQAHTLADLISEMAELTTLAALLKTADLLDLLREPGPHTVFAPTDAAFAQLHASAQTLLQADPQQLRAILCGHIVPGALLAADLMLLSTLTTRSGTRLSVVSAHGLQVGRSYLTYADYQADNGVLHHISAPLL